MTTLDEHARAIAEQIEADIGGRSALGDAWAEIDDDIRKEIRDTWIEIVMQEMVK